MTHFGSPPIKTLEWVTILTHTVIHDVHSNHGWISLEMGIETKYKPRNVDMVLIISKMADML